MQNIDIDSTVTSMLVLDGASNVRQRDISTLVRIGADNGLTITKTGPENVIHLGGATAGTAPLLTTRWVDLATFDLNFEGTGNMNLGNATSNVSTNVNTGTTGNMTLQGTTLYNTAGANNILYVDSTTHDVRSAPVQALTVNNTPTMFLTKDATGNITQSPNPSANFIRGQIAGTGTYTYTSPAMLINSGAAIICTIENHTGFLGAVIVQVTNVTTGVAGTFSVESSENIQTGSFINYTVMNP
jgi:hypothetical protein